MRAAQKKYAAPLTMSTTGRRDQTKTPVVYYTYDRHGERIELPQPSAHQRVPGAPVQIAMPIGGVR